MAGLTEAIAGLRTGAAGRADVRTFAPGEAIDLAALPTAADGPGGAAGDARERMRRDAARLRELQERLMAHETYGLLLLFQGMDASGKDEAIADALAGFDPRGCEFKHFKKMTEKEARHDWLWRAVAALPARGQVGVFNRSYYEHVLGERVHPERLEAQKLPPEAGEGEALWARRFAQVSAFERYLTENGILVLKLYLHVSKEVQRGRLLERLDDPDARWQFSATDVEERDVWDEHLRAASEALTATNTAHAPWLVIPADRPFVARAAVASVLADALAALHDGFPEPSPEEKREMAAARRRLLREAD